MTEVPEHLLQRAAEARARLSGGPAPDSGGGESAAAPVPAVAAPDPTPAVPEEPKAPEPVAPYVEARIRRKTLPIWIIPVLIFLPFWAIYYVGYLENPTVTGGFAFEGGEAYGGQCAGCHGGAGGGGTGRQLSGGEVIATFPANDEGVAQMVYWVSSGTAGAVDGVYGDPARSGGQRQAGSFGVMGGFGGSLSTEELAAVVYHERAAFGNLDDATIEHEIHLLVELVHVVDDAGESFDGASLDDVRLWVDAASAKLVADGEMAAE